MVEYTGYTVNQHCERTRRDRLLVGHRASAFYSTTTSATHHYCTAIVAFPDVEVPPWSLFPDVEAQSNTPKPLAALAHTYYCSLRVQYSIYPRPRPAIRPRIPHLTESFAYAREFYLVCIGYSLASRVRPVSSRFLPTIALLHTLLLVLGVINVNAQYYNTFSHFSIRIVLPLRGQDDLLPYAFRVALPSSTSVFVRGYSTSLVPISVTYSFCHLDTSWIGAVRSEALQFHLVCCLARLISHGWLC